MGKSEKLSTGILGLDVRIGGGLPPDGIGISVAGPHGLGKRILCMQILYEALKRGEPGMYVSVDNPYFEIREMFAQFGMNLKHYEEQNRFMIIDCTGTKPRTGENIDNIVFVNPHDGIGTYEEKCYTTKKEILGEGGVDVIDSTSSLMEFIGGPNEVLKVQRKFRIEIGLKLKTVGLHIVDLGTSLNGEVTKIFSFDQPSIWFRENQPYNQIWIRGMPRMSNTDVLDFKITDKGIVVLDSSRMIRKIFICSTCHDFRDLRAELKESLISWGYEPMLNEAADFPVKFGVDSYTACIEAVRNSDCLVLIVGTRYGGIIEGENISITQKEYQTAHENNIPTINFCLDSVWSLIEAQRKNPDFAYPSYFSEKKEKSDKIFEFLDVIRKYEKNKKDNWVHPFRNSVGLKKILESRLEQLRSEIWRK